MSDKPAKWLVRSIAQKKALKKSGIWRKQARSKISALVADVTPEIMNADALLGVDAEWDALDILFDQSTDELAKRKMVERINILEREHTILSEKNFTKPGTCINSRLRSAKPPSNSVKPRPRSRRAPRPSRSSHRF